MNIGAVLLRIVLRLTSYLAGCSLALGLDMVDNLGVLAYPSFPPVGGTSLKIKAAGHMETLHVLSICLLQSLPPVGGRAAVEANAKE